MCLAFPRIGNPLLYLYVTIIMRAHSYDYNKILVLVQIKCQNSQEEVLMHSPAPSAEPAARYMLVEGICDFLLFSFILQKDWRFPSIFLQCPGS